MFKQRQSGILLHPSSLPSPYGIGSIGQPARAFVKDLAGMGQSLWQMLPLGPTGYADSPYAPLSSFAGNPLLIGLDDLVADGLLDVSALATYPATDPQRVNYEQILPVHRLLLDQVAAGFDMRASQSLKAAYRRFAETRPWLEDYAIYAALKHRYGLQPWYEWPEALRKRDARALAQVKSECTREIQAIAIQQFLFHHQWQKLRRTCQDMGIRLVGDLPFCVARDSADAWANPELFRLDDALLPTEVAGVPPDYFSADGQLWGNPLYDWPCHRESGYAWWIDRLVAIFDQCDIVRIDHFRGFEACWAVPFGSPHAREGRWEPGPGHDFFQAIREQLGRLPIIAEDLGTITEDVHRLRDDFELPGMRVLHFCFGENQPDNLKPENFPENCIVYTGTHDNDTTRGWFHAQPGVNTASTQAQLDAERERMKAYLCSDGDEIEWDLMGLALNTPCNTAIIPMQDVLGLGSEARMNVPGTTVENWRWRMLRSALSDSTRGRIRDLSVNSGRSAP
jgi:4-alpha-glucanotransferase